MTDRRKWDCLSQKEHAYPNFLIQNVVHIATSPLAASKQDRGIRDRRQRPFHAENGVGLNLSTFLIDYGQNHRGLRECSRKCAAKVNGCSEKGQGIRKVLVLLLKEQSIGST
jgi:hypothetical protein